ncbi:MerR family transcriptional regulator [Azoarcus olearius]|uniref:Regulatory protein n=1 Tax=Azoarcus sp. (strain BH72) TaxID=418699 RepID=A1K566_AZOSB|nr:MerR family transcriptional regulator [Azoarcus olearius]ANQ84522.1 putative regulatory protein [Azoarcus olearius]CAL93971.1 putative regulatory protein [Azoarcus olearius]
MDHTYTIGQLAAQAEVGVETIRYYHRRGLLAEPERRGSYRAYQEDDLERLKAIRRAQQLGFSLEEIDELLGLNEERDREKARRIAQGKIDDIEVRIRQLEEMRGALRALVKCCRDTEAPAPCPILKSLAGK